MKTTRKIISAVVILGIGFAAGFFIPHKTTSLEKTEMTHDMGTMAGTMSGAMDMSVSDMAKLEGDDFDKKFVEDMIVHHQGAVNMARLAQKKSKREEIKALSADIIGAQTKEISMMKGWLALWFK